MEKDQQYSQLNQSSVSGRNTTQVGGNYTSNTNINLSIWVSLLLVIALGSYVTLGTDLLNNFIPNQSQLSLSDDNSDQ